MQYMLYLCCKANQALPLHLQTALVRPNLDNNLKSDGRLAQIWVSKAFHLLLLHV